MTIKSRKLLVMSGTLVLSTMLFAPSYAEETATAVEPNPVAETGTINVLTRVVNDNRGTKFPTDFTFTLKHHGSHIPGSPFIGVGNIGRTFVLPAGTYVLSTDIVDGYDGYWYNGAVVNGFIDLEAGENVAIVRVFEDDGRARAVVIADPTEDGGTLPNTATSTYNYLLAGSILAAAGALGIRKGIALGKVE
jgi:LPXTG-motif cell wall-anchored protein